MYSTVLLLAALSRGAWTQSSNSTSKLPAATTVNLFLGQDDSGAPDGFVASVIHVDQCGTTYALHCTKGSFVDTGIVSGFCDGSSTVTATYGPKSYGLSMVSTLPLLNGKDDGTVTVVQTCSLDSTTGAVCSITTAEELSGKSSAKSSVATFTGTDIVYGQVAITEGAEKLRVSKLPVCTSTSSGGAGAATGLNRVYKVVVIPGAAALLGGAFA